MKKVTPARWLRIGATATATVLLAGTLFGCSSGNDAGSGQAAVSQADIDAAEKDLWDSIRKRNGFDMLDRVVLEEDINQFIDDPLYMDLPIDYIPFESETSSIRMSSLQIPLLILLLS